jgi:two-component system chemotaxis response regulator CheB
MLTGAQGASTSRLSGRREALVIGGSAGALGALEIILPALPASTPWPVLVVVHLQPNHRSLLPDLFRRRCSLPVYEVCDKEPIVPGIWFAPTDYHLLVESTRTFALSVDEPVNYSRPSVDVLFESAADVYGETLLALVLTGANSDGANGARAARQRGGFVIVQDPETAEASMMPASAIERAGPQMVSSLPEIAATLHDFALAKSP